MPSRAVVWFRRDLRVADHPALLAALDAADQVVPVFVVDRALLDGRPSGPNRRAFLHGALQALANELGPLGGRLLVLEGDPVALLPRLAREFDPDGDYIRRWVPELAKLDPPAIFAPWRADPADLEAGGVRLGTDYPHPIVDHISARNRALSRFQEANAHRR
jgi:deoxyribodipyrimidine photolyase